jgi:hypothetical protein
MPIWIQVLMARYGWWLYRRQQGHPISLGRAFFKKVPRFSSYERDEKGCPDWALHDYEMVAQRTPT